MFKSTFVTYSVALDLVRALAPIVERLKLSSRDLADQIERAGTSLVLNLAEGSRRGGKDQRRFYVMAQGSASEIRAALEVAEAWGWTIEATEARAILDRELGLLWGLTHSRSSSTVQSRSH